MVTLEDFGERQHLFLDAADALWIVHRHADERRHVEPYRTRIDPGVVANDDSPLFELTNALNDAGCAKPNSVAKVLK